MNYYYICVDNERLDNICNKVYGQCNKVVEKVLAHSLNIHLANATHYSAGTKVWLPEIDLEALKPKLERIKIFE